MTDVYISIDEVRSLVGVSDSNDDALLTGALLSACRAIDDHCGRRFYVDADVSAREYRPDAVGLVRVHDFSTTTGLVVKTDDANDATYSTTWTVSTDFIVEPLNGLRDGRAWAYDAIRAVGARTFAGRVRPSVQVTAKWGWPSVPEPVKQATRLMTVAMWKRKDAAFGVAGFDQFGAVRVRDDPMVASLLSPYMEPVVA